MMSEQFEQIVVGKDDKYNKSILLPHCQCANISTHYLYKLSWFWIMAAGLMVVESGWKLVSTCDSYLRFALEPNHISSVLLALSCSHLDLVGHKYLITATQLKIHTGCLNVPQFAGSVRLVCHQHRIDALTRKLLLFWWYPLCILWIPKDKFKSLNPLAAKFFYTLQGARR